MNNPEPTIKLLESERTGHTQGHVARRHCPHCMAETVQVIQVGHEEFQHTCLQCIADGGSCCSLVTFNRWARDAG